MTELILPDIRQLLFNFLDEKDKKKKCEFFSEDVEPGFCS